MNNDRLLYTLPVVCTLPLQSITWLAVCTTSRVHVKPCNAIKHQSLTLTLTLTLNLNPCYQ